MPVDHARVRREYLRWVLILTLNNARPLGCYDDTALATAQGVYPDATRLEVQRELDYLAERALVDLDKRPDGRWIAKLNRYGVDVAEYTVDCEPGIARPEKYW
ncbi:hypothetical protein [Pseudodesulfovibrio sp.]|uniref:hypothetical protein n=1 Tax=Pseudodesulfovibrio sp. TaxID=2035812 RepID=UPI002604FED9|nr:hypothetical protein [Pseudodesulfovibrio sp.]MDD3310967.1 hypothetical protein [Pseudodesulfovibrio sp.]